MAAAAELVAAVAVASADQAVVASAGQVVVASADQAVEELAVRVDLAVLESVGQTPVELESVVRQAGQATVVLDQTYLRQR